MKNQLIFLGLLSILSISLNADINIHKCQSCHGVNGEKKALGKSKIIQKLSEKEIVKAIKGYQKGTYGGNFKGVMKGQVANLTNEDIKKAAKYFSTQSEKDKNK